MKGTGFVGLGTMGGPMAGHLVRAGHAVTVWNRTASKAEPLAALGATVAPSLEALGAGCDVVFLCVNRTEDVRACLDALTASAEPGTLFVDHSTISPPGAQEIFRDLAARGFGFVDAPITGGSMGAQNGTLTIFCGGEADAFAIAEPRMQAYAKRVAHVGPSGSGQMMKMANQIAVGGALIGLCEALAFADRAGLDLALARELIGGGAAGSWAFENYGPKVLARDWTPGFSIKNQRKDFGYCQEAAAGLGMELPGTRVVDDLLKRLEDEGRGEEATAALFDLLARRSPEA